MNKINELIRNAKKCMQDMEKDSDGKGPITETMGIVEALSKLDEVKKEMREVPFWEWNLDIPIKLDRRTTFTIKQGNRVIVELNLPQVEFFKRIIAYEYKEV